MAIRTANPRATLDVARRTEHHGTRPTVARLIADLEAEKRKRQDAERKFRDTEMKLEDATAKLVDHQATLGIVMDGFAHLELREESCQRRSPPYMHHWQGGQRRQHRVNEADTEAAPMKKELEIIREQIFEWANLLDGVESDLRTEYERSGKREIRLMGRGVRDLKAIMREALQFAWSDTWMSSTDYVY
ncbi:hypothetical protein BCR34DRAFT_596183 [Clohesyomyces aquaticus]|uniref:Uncharacterized protein n=1 Tax=Clohesyomyces aquaticus TaxID=1231657 RepID=A0A1Y2A7Z9_9PLEO|nr:hypothetical protein BCR34DRAFT_596183 [Clohesyomyces aquaticus]